MKQCSVCGREIIESQKKCQYCKSTTLKRVFNKTAEKAKEVIKTTADISVEKSAQLKDFTVSEVQRMNMAMQDKSIERKKRKLDKLTSEIETLEKVEK